MDITMTQILDGLGWALIHSLWQGLIAAVIVFMTRSFTRDSQASLRCSVEVFALAACFGAFLMTFWMQIGSGSASSLGSVTSSFFTNTPLETTGGVIAPSAGLQIGSASLGSYAPLLGIFWCLGFILLSLRYSYGLMMTRRLRTQGLSAAPTEWDRRFKTLVANTGIFRHVALHISDRVNSPMTLGFFKPIVLVPASFFAGLPASQIEAILLHEIAHIRRHDYLINLAQTAIKTILFYHPAIHYISQCIDDDREQACDDFAVKQTNNPAALVKGLAALRLDLARPRFALAAQQDRKPLLRRLTRLMAPEESRRRPEHVVTSMAALLVATGFYVTLNSSYANAHPKDETYQDTIKSTLHVSADEKNYHFATTRHNGRDITYKQAADGTRWVYMDNSWHDIDRNPAILNRMPQIPAAPVMPDPDNFNSYMKFEKSANQYRVNLDYYIASLGNMSGEEDLASMLHWAEKQKQRVSTPNPDFDVDYLSAKPVAKPSPTAKPAPAEKPLPVANPVPAVNAMPIQTPMPIAAPMPRVKSSQNLQSGIYIDGKKVDYNDHEDEMEVLTENFEDDMESIEDQFETALDRFENAAEQYAENPNKHEDHFKAAQKNFAKAVTKSNAKRDVLTQEFDREVNRIVNLEVDRALQDAERQHHEHGKNEMADPDGYKESLLKQLKVDQLIKQESSSADILFKEGLVFVNGKKIAHSKEDNYCKINKAYKIKKSDNMRVEVTPNRVTITDHAY